MTETVPGATLDPGELLAEATRVTGFTDFGEITEGLHQLIESATNEARFNAGGTMGMAGDIHRWLVNWARFRTALQTNPEILDEDVSDAVVITGIPRTGTTKLQRMVSGGPGMRALPLWQILNPAADDGADRLAFAAEMEKNLKEYSPVFMAMHPMGAEEAEEDAFLMQHSFRSLTNTMLFSVPSYMDWLVKQDQHIGYEYHRDMLKYLQWQHGGKADLKWVLKCPLHLGRIDTVLDVFPNSIIVHCHRDIEVAMASQLRAIEGVRSTSSDAVDLEEIGSSLEAFWSQEWERNLEQRALLTNDPRIIDVSYDDIKDNALELIRGIYDSAGMALTPDGEDQVLQWEKSNAQYKHGKVDYSLERYGLTRDSLSKAFSAYLDAFGDTGDARHV